MSRFNPENKKNAEIVIIGGGIMGISTAYFLAKRGQRDVILLERNLLAQASTGLCVGGIRQQFSHPANILLSQETIHLLQNFEEEFHTIVFASLHIPESFRRLFSDGGEDIKAFLFSLRDFFNTQIQRIENINSLVGPFDTDYFPFIFSEDGGHLTLILDEIQANALRETGVINFNEKEGYAKRCCRC